jgi:hypothetical protein
MTKRRRVVLLGVLVGGFGVLVVLLVLSRRDDRPSSLKVNYERIQRGMPLDQVEGIIGSNTGEILGKTDGGLKALGMVEKHWGARDGMASIFFDQDGRVTYKRWDPPRPSRFESLFRELHQLIGRK